MSTPLISADNTWALMAITCGWAAFSIYAEQTWKWASKVSGAIVALIGALVLTNLGIIPTNCVWFDDIVWGYVVPMAIPMLLLSCDIRKIGREAGKILVIFMIGAIGTSVGAILGFKVLGNHVKDLAGVAAMMTGSYIGGTVNFAAMASAFEVPGDTTSAAVVADNLLMTLYFFVLIMIPTLKFFKTKFTHPHIDEINARGVDEAAKTQAAAFWAKKPISLCNQLCNQRNRCLGFHRNRRSHFRSVPFRQRHNHRPDWRSVRQQVSDSDNHYNDYRDNFLQTSGGSVRFSGIGYIPDLPVLLCNRRTCIHQGYLPECTSAAGILCNHGNRKHAVLLRIRQAAEI